MNAPWDNRLDMSMVPAGAIGSITVSKGAPSVLYGANTLGGTINMVSLDQTTPCPSTTPPWPPQGKAGCVARNAPVSRDKRSKSPACSGNPPTQTSSFASIDHEESFAPGVEKHREQLS